MVRLDTHHLRAKRVFYGCLLAVIAVSVFGWWQGSSELLSSSDKLIAIARLFGILASISILIEVVLMSRIPLLEKNISLEDTIELHRLNGYLLVGMIVGHIVFMTLGYKTGDSTSLWQQFVYLNTSFEDVFKALIGTIIFFCATILTLGLVRKHLQYELWYATHLTIYFAILLTFLHQVNSGGDMVRHEWFKYFWFAIFGVVFALLAYYRFAKMFMSAAKHRFVVAGVLEEARGIYSIYITGNNVDSYAFIPGQYASWRFLTRGLWYEAHPFSFSQEPGHEMLRITAKASGDFSDKLQHLAPGTPVLVDGPRGAFTSRRANTKSITFIAGGIGVAPFLAKIPGFLRKGRIVTLLYSVRSSESVAFKEELNTLQKQGLRVHVFVTETGNRINDAALKASITKQTTVYICGPNAMTEQLPQKLIAAGLAKEQIITERFDF